MVGDKHRWRPNNKHAGNDHFQYDCRRGYSSKGSNVNHKYPQEACHSQNQEKIDNYPQPCPPDPFCCLVVKMMVERLHVWREVLILSRSLSATAPHAAAMSPSASRRSTSAQSLPSAQLG